MNTIWIRSVGERSGVSIVSAAKRIYGTSRCRRIVEYLWEGMITGRVELFLARI